MDPTNPNRPGIQSGPTAPSASSRPTGESSTSGNAAVEKQVPKGLGIEGKELNQRHTAKHTGAAPSITRPLHTQKSRTSRNIATSAALTQLKSSFELHDELIEETTQQKKAEMDERLERVYKSLQEHTRSGRKPPDSSFLERFTLDESGKSVLKLQNVKDMFDMILFREETSTRRLNQRGRSTDAWLDFFTERRNLVKLTREMAEVAAYHTENELETESQLLNSEPTTTATPLHEDLLGLDIPQLLSPPGVTSARPWTVDDLLLAPTLPTPLNSEAPLMTFPADQEEKQVLSEERDQLKERITVLEERLSVSESLQKNRTNSETLDRLKSLHSRLESIESRLQDKKTRHQEPHQEIKYTAGLAEEETVPLVGTGVRTEDSDGQLKGQLSQLRKNYDELQRDLQNRSEQVGSLRSELEHEKSGNSEQVRKLDEQRIQLRELTKQREELQEQYIQSQSQPMSGVESEATISELKTRLEDKQQQLDRETENTQELRTKVVTKQQEIEEKVQVLAELQKETASFQAESSAFQQQLQHVQEMSDKRDVSAEENFQLLNNYYEELKARSDLSFARAISIEDDLKEKLSHLQQGSEELSSQLRDKSNQMESLRSQLKDEQFQNRKKAEKLKEKKQSNKQLRKQRDNLLSKLDELQPQLTESGKNKEAVHQLEARLADKEGELRRGIESTEQLKIEVISQHQNMKEREQALSELRQAVSAFEVERLELKTQLEHVTEIADSQVSSAHESVGMLTREYDNLKENLTKLTDSVRHAIEQNQQLVDQKQTLSESNQALQSQLSDARKQVHQAEAIKVELEGQRMKSRELSEELHQIKEISESESQQRQQLSLDVVEKQTQLEMLQTQTQSLEVERNKLKQELEKAQKDQTAEKEVETGQQSKIIELEQEVSLKNEMLAELKETQSKVVDALTGKLEEQTEQLGKIEGLLDRKETFEQERLQLTTDFAKTKERSLSKIDELESQKNEVQRRLESIESEQKVQTAAQKEETKKLLAVVLELEKAKQLTSELIAENLQAQNGTQQLIVALKTHTEEKKELISQRDELSEKNGQLQAELLEIKLKVVSIEATVRTLDTCKARSEELFEELETTKTESGRLQLEREKLVTEVDEKNKQLELLESVAREAKGERDELKATLEQIRISETSEKMTSAALQERVDGLLEGISEKEKEIAELKESQSLIMTEMTSKLEEQTQQLIRIERLLEREKNLEKEKEGLQNELSESLEQNQSKLRELESEKNDILSEFHKVKEEKDNLLTIHQQEVELIKDELGQEREISSKKQNRVEKLENAEKLLQSNMQGKEQELEALRSTVSEIESLNSDLKEEIRGFESKKLIDSKTIEEQKQEADRVKLELTTKIEEIQKETDEQKTELEEQRRKITDLEDSLNSTKKELDEIKEKHKALKGRETDLLSEIDREKISKFEVELKVNASEELNRQLSTQVASLTKNLEEEESELKIKLTELSSARDETQRLKEDVLKAESLTEILSKDKTDLEEKLEVAEAEKQRSEDLINQSKELQKTSSSETASPALTDKTAEFDRLQRDLKANESALEKSEASVLAFTQKAEETESRCQKLTEQYKESLEEKGRVEKDLEDSKSLAIRLTQKVDDLEGKVKELTDTENAAKTEAKNSRAKTRGIGEELTQLRQEKDRLTGELQVIRKEMEEATVDVDSKLKKSLEQQATLKNNLRIKQKEFNTLTDQLKQAESDLKESKERETEALESLRAVTDERTNLKQQLDQKTEELTGNLEKIQQLRSSVQEQMHDKEIVLKGKDTVEAELSKLNAEKVSVDSELSNSKKTVQDLESKLQQFQSEHEHLKEQNRELEVTKGSELRGLSEALTKKNDEVTELSRKLEAELKNSSSLKAIKEGLTSELKEKEGEYDRQKTVIEEKDKLIQQNQKEIDALKKQVEALGRELKLLLDGKNRESAEHVEAVSKINAQHEAEKEKLISKLDQVKDQNKVLENGVAELDAVKEEKEAAAAAKDQLLALKAELSQKESQFKETKDELTQEKDKTTAEKKELFDKLTTEREATDELKIKISQQAERLGQVKSQLLVEEAVAIDEGIASTLSRSNSSLSTYSEIFIEEEALDKELTSKAASQLLQGLETLPVTTLKRSRLQTKVRDEYDLLQTQVQELAKKHLAYKVDLNIPLSDQEHRRNLLGVHQSFSVIVADMSEAVKAEIGNDQETDVFYHHLNAIANMAQDSVLKLKSKVSAFDDFSAQIKSLQEEKMEQKGKQKANDLVDNVFQNIKAVRDTTEAGTNPEYYGYAVGQMIKEAADQMCKDFKSELQMLQTPDVRHKLLSEYRSAIRRLSSQSLPDKVKAGLPHNVSIYLSDIWLRADNTLDGEMGLGDSPKTTEERMLRSPKFSHHIVHLISRLSKEIKKQDESAADTNENFSYSRSSLLSRQSLRREHQLDTVPVMSRLLKAAEADLKSDGSQLLMVATEGHRGNYGTSTETARRVKLLERVQRLQQKEETLGAAHSDIGVRVNEYGTELPHKHQMMLDCFNQRGGSVLEKQGNVTEDDSYYIQSLGASKGGVINVFLAELPSGGEGVLKTSKATGEMTLSLPDDVSCQPPLVFQSRDSKRWTTLLNGITWTVDPSIIHDNPNLKIPFENKDGSQWDWLPLRNDSGEASIILLEKTVNPMRCLMYEQDGSGRLVAMPLQGKDTREEYTEAMLLESAAYLTDESPVCSGEPVSDPTLKLKQLLDRPWLKTSDSSQTKKKLRQLEQLRTDIEKEAAQRIRSTPFETESIDRSTGIKLPEIAKIDREKSQKASSGAKVDTCKSVSLDRFTVSTDFDTMTRQFVEKRKQALSDPDQMQFLLDESKAFAKTAFPVMRVFSGCELLPLTGETTRFHAKANRAEVRLALNKVIETTNKQCAYARELKSTFESSLVQAIRSSSSSSIKYTDRQLLDYAITRFERGELPKGLNDSESFAQKMAELMLIDIDLQQREQISSQLGVLKTSFEHLCNNAVFTEQEPAEYTRKCREWNLNMATVTERQQQVIKRVSSYNKQLLDSDTRALLSFERRRKIVLSPDQAEEVKRDLGAIRRWSEGERVALVSHKGTGYGKSTILLAISDNAAALAGPRTNRTALVMAPPSNQAELDVMFGSYFDSKGLTYHRLDMQALSTRLEPPISEAHLNIIENTLLGLPEYTSEASRADLLKLGRAPVGASITDIQALIHIKNGLSDAGCNVPDREKLLVKVDHLLDLLRNSMILADEWDSAMVPHTPEQLSEVSEGVNRVLKGMGLEIRIEPEMLISSHAEFLFGANRHGFSATLGTDYAAAMLTGSASAKEVKEQARTDVLTTNGRFMHLMSQADLVTFDSAEDPDHEALLSHLVKRTGGDAPMVIFNGRDDGKDRGKAEKLSIVLNEERRKIKKPVKGVLYYNDDKKLCLQKDGDPVYGKGSELRGDLEKQLRMTGSWDADGYLSKREAVGTDAPQGQKSVGVVMGLVKQTGSDARMELMTQEVGRVIRASKDLHKPQKLIVVVDQQELSALPDSAEKEALMASKIQLEHAKNKLEAELSVQIDLTMGDLRAQIFSPVKVPQPRLTRGQSIETELPKAFEKELVRIQQEDWSTLKLTRKQKLALVQLKRSQWSMQQNWMKLLATEMANRQVTKETMGYENRIEQARVNAYLNKAYSEQHEWLQGDGVAMNLNPYLDDENETLRLAGGAFSTEFHIHLVETSRRQIKESVDVKELTEAASMTKLREELNTFFDEMDKNGVMHKKEDMLTEPHNNLIIQSKIAFESIKSKVEEIDSALKKLGDHCTGREAFRSIITTLDDHISAVKESDISVAKNTEKLVRGCLEAMMQAVTNIVFDESGKKSEAVDQILGVVKKCVKINEKEFRLTADHGTNNTAVTKLNLKPPGHAGSHLSRFCWQTKVGTGPFKPLREKLYLAEGHYAHKASAIENMAQLKRAKEVVSQATSSQATKDDAVDICTNANNPHRTKLVQKMRQKFMSRFDQFSESQNKEAKAEQAVMEQQLKLKQENQQIKPT